MVAAKEVIGSKPKRLPFFIGTKLVQAVPMANTAKHAGYKIVYPDGYESWSPKTVFEAAYMPLNASTNAITQEIVNNFILDTQVTKLGIKTTAVQVTLKNGFVLVETSSCVDPANYDKEIGTRICVARINEKIWMLLGFLLQTSIGGVNQIIKKN